VEEQYRARNTDHATSLCRTLAGATEPRWVKKLKQCQKIEAVEGVVPAGVASSVGIADLPIFVLGCCELHSQEQAQLKVGAFQPQPSVYQK
jgi:hypothetical protein